MRASGPALIASTRGSKPVARLMPSLDDAIAAACEKARGMLAAGFRIVHRQCPPEPGTMLRPLLTLAPARRRRRGACPCIDHEQASAGSLSAALLARQLAVQRVARSLNVRFGQRREGHRQLISSLSRAAERALQPALKGDERRGRLLSKPACAGPLQPARTLFMASRRAQAHRAWMRQPSM